MSKEPIYVTKTHLPSLEEYQKLLREIWDSGQLTNYGEKTIRLTEMLESHLKVPNLLLVNNGTIALQLAIKALGLKGEIITTPFSYVATVSSIVWEGCTPVFVDIAESDMCIDPDKIEAAITPETSAILATHVYGFPCDAEKIASIAKKHNIKVIYDAAHAFGVELNGKSVLSYGDVSTLSFHATKIFHTGEGGAVISTDSELAHTINFHGNFGHKNQEEFYGLGVNSKISEIHAALGLLMLPEMPKVIEHRKKVSQLYDTHLMPLEQIRVFRPREDVRHNYSYYPVVFDNEETCLKVRDALNESGIFPRRYFYPSLNMLPYVAYVEMPIAESISKRILCLPLSSELSTEDVVRISTIISTNLN